MKFNQLKNLNQLKIAIRYNSNSCFLRITQFSNQFLQFLLRYNMVRSITNNVTTSKKFKVNLSSINKQLIIKNIVWLVRPNSKKSTTIKILKKNANSTLYIVSTSIGLIDKQKCYYKNTGGLILAKIII